VLAYDTYRGMWFSTPSGAKEWGIGVGTIVLGMNVTFLSMYTLGCHSLRHVVGGLRWAWTSLVWVLFTDVYVRLCSVGVISDIRLL